MNKIFLKISVLLIAINMISCSEDTSIISNNSKNELKDGTGALRVGANKDGILFTYANNTEYQSGMQTATTNIITDDDDLLKINSQYTHIINRVRVSNGSGLLTEKHFINMNTNKVVKSLILDINTLNYNETNQNVPINNVSGLGTGCPSGTSQIATCSKLNGALDYGACMGIAVANYAVNHSAVGQCTQYQFVNNGLSSTVCAGSGGCN
jgi:hypothetical protein